MLQVDDTVPAISMELCTSYYYVVNGIKLIYEIYFQYGKKNISKLT
jgi:hypothetical protein